MSLPTQKKMLTKFEIIKENRKHESTTKAIRNLGNMLTLKFLALNKISGKPTLPAGRLKFSRFKIPNYA